MFQRWTNLLFLHWTMDPAEIQRTLPDGLTVDTFGGDAYAGVVPFFMRGVRPAWLPPVPWLSNFQELNVRTYVHTSDGTPGVWFYSLDCNQPVAVWTARTFFHLPYFHARMDWEIEKGALRYRSRQKPDAVTAEYHYQCASIAPAATRPADADDLEFFLLERYYLFSKDQDGNLRRGQVAHDPYRFSLSNPEKWSERPLELAGLSTGGRRPDHCCVAEDVNVRIFGLQRVGPNL
jgi:uncharacterized protein YqjF (DUF2071 family)